MSFLYFSYNIYANVFFAPYLEIFFFSNGLFLTFFFTRCFPISFTRASAFLFTSERENFFAATCSKIAVECYWNSGISQNVQALGFFGKKDGFFQKKLELYQSLYMGQMFSRMRLKWYSFLKMSFYFFWRSF